VRDRSLNDDINSTVSYSGAKPSIREEGGGCGVARMRDTFVGRRFLRMDFSFGLVP
jgi:hypothetical protein